MVKNEEANQNVLVHSLVAATKTKLNNPPDSNRKMTTNNHFNCYF